MYIDFEGITGSGKTALIERVAARLSRLGHRVTQASCSPHAGSAASRLLQVESEAEALGLHPRSELFLSLARQTQLLEDVVRPSLRRGEVCFTEGALYSQLASAGARLGLGPSKLASVFELADANLPPDLIVLLDVDPELGRWRTRASGTAESAGSHGTQVTARATLLSLAQRDPARWLVLENEGRPLHVLEERIAEAILARLERRDAQVEPVLPQPHRLSQPERPEQVKPSFFTAIDLLMDREPEVALAMLTGFGGFAAMRRRLDALERWPQAVAKSLAGVSGSDADAIREVLLELAPNELALGLAGMSGPSADRFRTQLFDAAPGEVVSTLAGDDRESAWELRERALAKGFEAEVLEGLCGLDGARAWRVRSAGLSRGWTAAVAKSLEGLTGLDAETLRDRLFVDAPVPVIGSTAGLSSPHAAGLRERLLERAPGAVLRSVRGLKDDASQLLREKCAARFPEAIASLAGIDDERAWALRERFVAQWPEAVADSFGELANEPRASALVIRILALHGDCVGVLRALYAALSRGASRPSAPQPTAIPVASVPSAPAE